MDITERAIKLLDTVEPSVSGSRGHDRLFTAAAALVIGFDLDDATAKTLLVSHFNPRCKPPWNDREIDHKIAQVKTHCKEPRGYLIGRSGTSSGCPSKPPISREPSMPTPTPERIAKRQQFEPTALQKMMLRGFDPNHAWLAERSPWDPRRVTPQAFLDAIFQPGEKSIIFMKYASQGQLGHIAGTSDTPGKTYYVGDRPGLRPTPCVEFPSHGYEGIWFLPSPIDGKWHPNGKVDNYGNPELSRRTGRSVTCYRHMLLESDNAPENDWLNLICQLPLPITALYTSGSRSIHALVKIDAKSKSEFDAFRDRISPLLSKLGADPASISGVRLTRLPGVLRDGTTDKDGRYHKFDPPRLQQLLYLNPHPELSAIRLLPRRRQIQ
jgi:hypothetical protein